MASSDMKKLELGMNKDQVIAILGSSYTVAEKRKQDDKIIEVLSYRAYFHPDEIYLFVFKNNELERWYRELVTQENIGTSNQQLQTGTK